MGNARSEEGIKEEKSWEDNTIPGINVFLHTVSGGIDRDHLYQSIRGESYGRGDVTIRMEGNGGGKINQEQRD